ncbi:MAG: cation diffusion facilitator family transporter [Pseudolabrys sp.]|nr:cation diffusion facilitator family transporter [Pseudolabrys sp.]MCW5683014.1 cation diffusion facilitator family transporter [Pseudolabrys sp.]
MDQKYKERVALTSLFASLGLTIAKAVVGVMTGSLGILSEAGHSLIDFGATVMTLIAVRISGKPADDEHHYGHGKVEAISALAETALLFLLSAAVIFEAVRRLFFHEGVHVEATIWAFAVMTASVVVDFFRARALSRAAKATGSQALEADALHFSSDLWSSLAVLVGLGGVWLGLPWADAVAAIAVAILICLVGWRLVRRTVDTLTDAAPRGVRERVVEIARRMPGVVAVERIRVRSSGEKDFIDLDVAVNRGLPLDRVSAVKDRLTAAIMKDSPRTEVNVTTEPRAVDDETIHEKVMVIARNRALAVHHVTVHEIGDRLSVSLDLEVDGKLTLVDAHRIADQLEEAIEEELGPTVEVETHIEPLQPVDAGREAPPERVAVVTAALAEIAAAGKVVREVHDVRVRETADGEIVNFHCRVDPALTVAMVHDKVDEVERGLKRRSPLIKRVIGHAEPIR